MGKTTRAKHEQEIRQNSDLAFYNVDSSISLVSRWWDKAVQRHPVLRTRLVHTPMGIFQVVLTASKAVKWSSDDNLAEYLLRDQVNYMTLGQELLRLGIVQTPGSRERFFIFTVQHVIYDAFMRSKLFKDVEAAYFNDFPDNNPLPKMNKYIKYITEADNHTVTKFWTSYLEGVETKSLLNTVDNPKVLNVSKQRMSTAKRSRPIKAWLKYHCQRSSKLPVPLPLRAQ